jgi:hypothetical protein
VPTTLVKLLPMSLDNTVTDVSGPYRVFFLPEVQIGIRRWIDVAADRGVMLVAAADQLVEKGLITCMHYGRLFR